MTLKIPTLQEATNQNIISFEAKLNQKIPLTDQAFIQVLAFIQAASQTGLYKYGIERSLQTLALTATGQDLIKIGRNYGVYKKPAIAAVLNISLPAIDDTIIDASNAFIGDANGIRYIPDASATAINGYALLTVTAEELGIVGNLNIDDTLTIESQIAGAESIATVTAIDTLGVEEETEDAYRERVLNEIRTVGGGGNMVDYRTWATQTPGVYRAFPYAGRPLFAGVSLPGERTVYIEAEKSIDTDGIADENLCNLARSYIATDLETEQDRPPIGLPNESDENGGTLWVESITRTDMFVEIRNLIVDEDKENQLKTELVTDIDNYFRSITPYVDGVDVKIERNDTITSITVGTISQTLFIKYGASASSIGFGTSLGVFLTSYILGQGELAKLKQIDYVNI